MYLYIIHRKVEYRYMYVCIMYSMYNINDLTCQYEMSIAISARLW